MTASPSRHQWIGTTAGPGAPATPLATPAPALEVWCHRRLRGPFTGGGNLMRQLVPELLERHPHLVKDRVTEIAAVAPELADVGMLAPQTLTNTASHKERTRFYPATRALRIAHGLAELLMEWARAEHPDGVVIAFRDLDHADPTDRDLAAALLRRCDPAVLTVIAEADAAGDDLLGKALVAHAERSDAVLAPRQAPESPGSDPAQQYIDSDGTLRDPAVIAAYEALPAEERERRHTERAEHLAEHGELTHRYGAIPFHAERGGDPAGAGLRACYVAVDELFKVGFYEAVLDLALRGRVLVADTKPKEYFQFTHKVGACLSYLDRGADAIAYLHEERQGSIDPIVHMNGAYQLAMLYTRFLPKKDHDEPAAMAWVNTALALAENQPDPTLRALFRAFMRNARALVELHSRNAQGALDLVTEAMAITDAECGPDEQLLHRSVLLYNRAQVLAANGDFVGSLRDYDDLISRDPEYGDYYFERAAQRRAAGDPEAALADYAEAIRLSAPFYEAHYNRADLLRELERDDEAMRDLDYALELEPDHVDSLVNRSDLLLSLGEVDRARADIEHGLTVEPDNANLLAAQGALFEACDDVQGALASYTAALAADPELTVAWVNRAVLAFSAGRPADALADLDAAIALGDDPALRANRAIALQDLGEHDRAVTDLDAALAEGADDPSLLFRRGLSRQALGDGPGARADWRAHLDACGPEESPFLAEIRAQAPEIVAGLAVSMP
ncbi:MAG: tetratricopeptide repeat protein [Catenulispora sp.]|nr:tetratricopeptide repeat protein [Catenulispora sp.]